MVEYESNQELSAVLHALSDPSRRQMLEALRGGPRSVGELAAPLDMTFAGASKHVGVLERAHLLTRKRDGRRRICRLRPDGLTAVETWLKDYTSYWTERLDALSALVEEESDEGGTDG